ncbi:MAG: hypothetical protein Q3986_06560 [Akkermansia sp.]|nr:hypothetical protein [Akkermansia sp.]
MTSNGWTETLKSGLVAACASAGLDVAVYSEVEEAHVRGNCIRIETRSVEDLIPGNQTLEVKGVVESRVSSAGGTESGMRTLLGSMQGVVESYLGSIAAGWEPNGAGSAPMVLQHQWWPSPNSTENPYYIAAVEWRAVLQF